MKNKLKTKLNAPVPQCRPHDSACAPNGFELIRRIHCRNLPLKQIPWNRFPETFLCRVNVEQVSPITDQRKTLPEPHRAYWSRPQCGWCFAINHWIDASSIRNSDPWMLSECGALSHYAVQAFTSSTRLRLDSFGKRRCGRSIPIFKCLQRALPARRHLPMSSSPRR